MGDLRRRASRTADSIASPGGYSEAYFYDGLGRLSEHHVSADGTLFQINRGYSPTTGHLDTLTYPHSHGGARLTLAHDYQHGFLWRIRDAATGHTYWQLNNTNEYGRTQVESFGNGVVAYSEYDAATGWLRVRQAGVGGGTGLVHASTWWDANGNLTRRQDHRQGVWEDFAYDALNRLDFSQRNGVTNLDVTLDAVGNVTYRSGVGAYAYHPTKRRAVVSAGGNSYAYNANGWLTSRNGQALGWASFGLPTSIPAAGGQSSTLWYGAFRNRYKQVAVGASGTETTLSIAGLLDRVTRAGVTEDRHAIHGPNGVVALFTRRNAAPATDTVYLHRDHLGSVDLVTDAAGTALVRPSFGAYGERRGADWQGSPSPADGTAFADRTRRGYTGHEHLDSVGLIHMNGRVYDPAIGRFLSPDPLIPDLYGPQHLNPYAYVTNNPLAYTDPSGFSPRPTLDERTENDGVEPPIGVGPQIPPPAAPLKVDGLTTAPRINVPTPPPATPIRFSDVHVILNTASIVMEGSVVLAPFAGIPDIGSGLLSGLEGDWVGAVLSMCAAAPGAGNACNAAKVTRSIRPRAHSVVFETSVKRTGAGTREAHKAAANRSLASAMSDADFSKMMNAMGVKPVGGTNTPQGFIWHHAPDRPGVMQLVPESQHTKGSPFWDVLHPGGAGAFAQWGRGW